MCVKIRIDSFLSRKLSNALSAYLFNLALCTKLALVSSLYSDYRQRRKTSRFFTLSLKRLAGDGANMNVKRILWKTYFLQKSTRIFNLYFIKRLIFKFRMNSSWKMWNLLSRTSFFSTLWPSHSPHTLVTCIS